MGDGRSPEGVFSLKTVVLILFVALYAFMIAKPKYRTWAALAAAVIVCALGVVPLRELPDAIDFNVLMMIGGTMIVVDYFIESGMPGLLAEALLKRSGMPKEDNPAEIIEIDGLRLNIPAHEFTLGGRELDLKIKEYSILEKLISNPGRIFSRDMLLDDIWGVDFTGDSRTVDSHLARLRTKLGKWGEDHIKTVFGVGYKLEVNS